MFSTILIYFPLQSCSRLICIWNCMWMMRYMYLYKSNKIYLSIIFCLLSVGQINIGIRQGSQTDLHLYVNIYVYAYVFTVYVYGCSVYVYMCMCMYSLYMYMGVVYMCICVCIHCICIYVYAYVFTVYVYGCSVYVYMYMYMNIEIHLNTFVINIVSLFLLLLHF